MGRKKRGVRYGSLLGAARERLRGGDHETLPGGDATERPHSAKEKLRGSHAWLWIGPALALIGFVVLFPIAYTGYISVISNLFNTTQTYVNLSSLDVEFLLHRVANARTLHKLKPGNSRRVFSLAMQIA